MNHPRRNRADSRVSSLSAGMRWASTITTIGLEMALPPLVGAWLDERFGTSPVWVLVLAVLGFAVAMMHLWRLAQRLGKNSRSRRSNREGRNS